MRYITREGVEARLGSAADCAQAIQSGALTARSLVYDEGSRRWVKASEHGYLDAFFAGAGAGGVPLFAAVLAWVIGLVDPPLIAVLHRGDVPLAAAQAIGVAVLLGVAGAIARLFVKTPRSRTLLALGLGVLLCLAEYPLLQLQAERQLLHASAQSLQKALAAATSAADALSQTSLSGSARSPLARASSAGTPAPGAAAAGTPAPGAGSVGAPAPGAASAGSSAARAGSAGASGLLDAIASLIQDDSRLSAQYQQHYAALHAETLLAPETLVHRARLRAASARLSDWSAYVDSYERDQDRLQAGFESQVAALNLPDSLKVAFIKSYDAGKQRTQPDTQRARAVESSLNSEIRGLYTFMSRRMGSARLLRSNRLQFPIPADAAAYHAQVKRIRALVAEEASLRSELLQIRQDGMAKLQALARAAAAQ